MDFFVTSCGKLCEIHSLRRQHDDPMSLSFLVGMPVSGTVTPYNPHKAQSWAELLSWMVVFQDVSFPFQFQFHLPCDKEMPGPLSLAARHPKELASMSRKDMAQVAW